MQISDIYRWRAIKSRFYNKLPIYPVSVNITAAALQGSIIYDLVATFTIPYHVRASAYIPNTV
jgi:hypothetical protein